ncbi:MAG: group 1 glycosyl transferase [candidate division Zixibacteria bacterium RBG-1]|nr:MAG: group 1 glycosyl transferase [candidate division Zixibacteria bacterium RBG-1]OGC85338.1 MAG: hypothetical protein A2V73_08965 [candidate division Zixibacteria bacterium RBG_19FT_COMBO_42_43]
MLKNIQNKILILTSVHPPFDTRIFYKQAQTLVKAGYQVGLIAQHDRDEIKDGVNIIAIPKPKNRLERMLFTTMSLLRRALKQNAQVYHFHDPELIPAGLFLKLCGKKVVYDIHEDYKRQFLSKSWIKPFLRPWVSKMFSNFEEKSSRFFDHLVIVDQFIAGRFNNKSKLTVIPNYPLVSHFKNLKSNGNPSEKNGKCVVIYAGGLSKERGLFKMLDAVSCLTEKNLELHLLGKLENPKNEEKIKKVGNVKYLGWVSSNEVLPYLLRADMGLILLQPTPDYLNVGEGVNKIFEYMLCGLPVIASDFPNIRKIIEGNKCGICVDPTDPGKIAEAIKYLKQNPAQAKKMGKNGREAVLKKYNWENEEHKLLKLYTSLTGTICAA